MPLAVRALLFLLLCLVPAGVVQVALEGEARDRRSEQIGDQTMRLVRLVAQQQIRTLEGARQLLMAITAEDSIRAGVPSEACDAYLGRIVRQDLRYHTASTFGLDGRRICSSNGLTRDISVADRSYFQNALAGEDLSVGDYERGMGTDRASLQVAVPVRDTDGGIMAVAVVALSVEFLNGDLSALNLPDGSAAAIADRQGVIVARTPNGESYVGTRLPQEVQFMVEGRVPEVRHLLSLDGVRRVVAYIPPAVPPLGLMVAVGIDGDPLIAAEQHRDRRSALLIVGSLMTSLAIGIALFHFGVERPVRILLEAAQAWARQDWSRRVGRLPGGREFIRLGEALDDMAEEARRSDVDRAIAASRMKVLSDVSPQVFFTTDERGRPDWFNIHWRELTGQTVAEAQGAGWLRAVHRADRARVIAAWRRLNETGSAEAMGDVELRVCLAGGDDWRWFLCRAAPIRRGDGSVESWVGIMLDVHDLHAAREEAAEHAARLTATYRNVPVGLCLFDTELRFLVVNEVFAAIDGAPPEAHVGRTIAEITPELGPLLEPRLRQVLATGQGIPDFELAGTQIGDTEAPRYWLCQFQPVLAADGHVTGITAAVVDITERKRAEQTQMLLAREVDHRSRNVLAVVRSIVRMTAAESVHTVDSLVEALEGRIAALGRVHTLLSATRWGGAGLAEIARAETAVAGSQATVEGPPVQLSAHAAQALAMVLHELATNASKHGALSRPGGELAVRWTRDEAGVELHWTERGGPPVAGPPLRRGFGSELVDVNVNGPMAGRVERHWDPDGLRCVIRIGAVVLARN